MDDIARYEIYYSQSEIPWTTDECSQVVAGDTIQKVTVTDFNPGKEETKIIEPVKNDTTYYVRIVAWDKSEQCSISAQKSILVERALTLTELTGEKGGFACFGLAPSGQGFRGSGAWLAAAPGIGLLLWRIKRRWRSRRARLDSRPPVGRAGIQTCPTDFGALVEEGPVRKATGLLALLLLWGSAVQAKEEEPRSHFGAGLSYAQVYFADKVFQEVFKQDDLLGGRLTFTWYTVRNLGLTGGLDGFYASGFAVDKTGRQSGEKLKLYVIPAQLELTYRFDFLNEQVLVPSLSVGGDYWLFREDNEFAKNVEGGKNGWHAGAGLGILLDPLEPDWLWNLESEFGVENVFLELGVQRTYLSQSGLDFSGWVYSAGLLFEF